MFWSSTARCQRTGFEISAVAMELAAPASQSTLEAGTALTERTRFLLKEVSLHV